MIEVLILSLVQGVTEFLPISSSSHLILISEFFNFQTQSLSIDVSLHIGSFIAVITYFRRDLQDFFRNIQLFIKIIVSSLPVMIAGLFLVKTGAKVIIDYAHTPEALKNILKTLRLFKKGNLIIVFGAGGDRDQGKTERLEQSFALINGLRCALLGSEVVLRKYDHQQPGHCHA